MAVATVIPDRSVAQRNEALKRANARRVKRAQMKRDAKGLGRADGALYLAEMVERPPAWLSTMKVHAFLRAVPGWGDHHVREAMARHNISAVKTVGGLSARQRRALAFAVEAWSRR